MAFVRCLIVTAVLVGVAALPGCSDAECEPCTEESPCPDFTGDYFGTVTGQYDDCDMFDLLLGDSSMHVLSQDNDADDKQTSLQIEWRDHRGLWGVYDGYLCNTTDEDEENIYVFNASQIPDMQGNEGYELYYQLTGYFQGPGEETPPEVQANLTINITMTDNKERCTLRGSYHAIRTE